MPAHRSRGFLARFVPDFVLLHGARRLLYALGGSLEKVRFALATIDHHYHTINRGQGAGERSP
jgi:hypothetical protein